MAVIPAETVHLIPRRGSMIWRFGGDARLMAGAGATLLMQVAHPTVAAGVREHSDFARDPWGRLLRTLDYVYLMSYGGPEAAAHTGRRLRETHRRIRGVAPDGTRYHALEPTAFAWVHATLVEGIVLGHERFGRPMRPEQVEQLYREWRDLGQVIGVRERDLPEDWSGFRAYYDQMIDERLEGNDVVDEVVSTLRRPALPPLRLLNDPAWRVLRRPLARTAGLATVGLIPARLRARLDLPWTPAQERELRAVAGVSRGLTAVLPATLRNVGPAYLRWRRSAIARGEMGVPRASGRGLASAA